MFTTKFTLFVTLALAAYSNSLPVEADVDRPSASIDTQFITVTSSLPLYTTEAMTAALSVSTTSAVPTNNGKRDPAIPSVGTALASGSPSIPTTSLSITPATPSLSVPSLSTPSAPTVPSVSTLPAAPTPNGKRDTAIPSVGASGQTNSASIPSPTFPTTPATPSAPSLPSPSAPAVPVVPSADPFAAVAHVDVVYLPDVAVPVAPPDTGATDAFPASKATTLATVSVSATDLPTPDVTLTQPLPSQ